MSNKTDQPTLNTHKNDTNLKTTTPSSKTPSSKLKQSRWNRFKRLFSQTKPQKINSKISTPSGKVEPQKKASPQDHIKGPEIPKDSVQFTKELQTDLIIKKPNKNPEIAQKEITLEETKTQGIPKRSEKSQGLPKESPFNSGSLDFFSKISRGSLKEDLSKLFKDYEQLFEVLEKPNENGKSMKDLKEMSDDIERRSDEFVQKVEDMCKNEKLEVDKRNIVTA